MRFLRIPYIYLSTKPLSFVHGKTHGVLKVIHDIHHNIPNPGHIDPSVRHFLYYADFVKWVHDKSADEIAKRGINHQSPLSEGIRNLRSRSLGYFLPPTDKEIADDVVYLLELWKLGKFDQSGQKLPWSYVELANRIYGYNPDKAALPGIGDVSGHHYHSDAGWYQI